jgi:hypothetical protein
MIWKIWKKSSFHISTYFSSIFSRSFHNFLPYFLNVFTIQLGFLPYFPNLITFQLTILPCFPCVFTIQRTFLPYFTCGIKPLFFRIWLPLVFFRHATGFKWILFLIFLIHLLILFTDKWAGCYWCRSLFKLSFHNVGLYWTPPCSFSFNILVSTSSSAGWYCHELWKRDHTNVGNHFNVSRLMFSCWQTLEE